MAPKPDGKADIVVSDYAAARNVTSVTTTAVAAT